MSDSILTATMAELTQPQVERAARLATPVLVPVGVIEAHGPHLPLGTGIYGAQRSGSDEATRSTTPAGAD